MVDLLEERHRQGRRFEPTEFIEEGTRVAVQLTVTDVRWEGETAQIYKVFAFRDDGDAIGTATLYQDCIDRDDALAYLESA